MPKAGKKISFETVNYTWDYEEKEWNQKNYGGIGLDTVFQAALPKPIFIKAMPTEAEAEAIINEILKQNLLMRCLFLPMKACQSFEIKSALCLIQS